MGFFAVVLAAVGFLVVALALVVLEVVAFALVAGLAAAVFRAVVFLEAAGRLVAVVGVSAASSFVFPFFFPFTTGATGAGSPSHTGRIPIVQSTGFCA